MIKLLKYLFIGLFISLNISFNLVINPLLIFYVIIYWLIDLLIEFFIQLFIHSFISSFIHKLYPTQRVAKGLMFLTRPSDSQSVRQSWVCVFFGQCNSSETAKQNLVKL